MIEIDQIAEDKSKETGHPMEEWEQTLTDCSESLAIGGLTDGEYLQLAKACTSPEAYRMCTVLFDFHADLNPDAKSGYDIVVDHTDQSSFGLSAWVDGLLWVYRWVNHHAIKPDLMKMIGYVQCCSMSLEGSAQGDLAQTTKDMLESEGYEG
ncbi:MAG: hypothetical protein HRT45_08415 [Bdellovibrionales bacterium]|nr:hypothetical protein [Bdellovibrionales bacterium]